MVLDLSGSDNDYEIKEDRFIKTRQFWERFLCSTRLVCNMTCEVVEALECV